MVHHYMEDAPEKTQIPSITSTVLPHPDALTNALTPVKEEPSSPPCSVAPSALPAQESPAPPPPTPCKPKKPDKATCCPFLPEEPPPTMALDIRDLSTTLFGAFALGATCALALAYFSRRQVVLDA